MSENSMIKKEANVINKEKQIGGEGMTEYAFVKDGNVVFAIKEIKVIIPFGNPDLKEYFIVFMDGETKTNVVLNKQRNINMVLDLLRKARMLKVGETPKPIKVKTLGKFVKAIKRELLFGMRVAKPLSIETVDRNIVIEKRQKALKASTIGTIINRQKKLNVRRTVKLIESGDLVLAFVDISKRGTDTPFFDLNYTTGLVPIGGGSGYTRGLFVSNFDGLTKKQRLEKVYAVAKIVSKEFGYYHEVFDDKGNLNSKALFKGSLLLNRTGMVNDLDGTFKFLAVPGTEDGVIFRAVPKVLRRFTRKIGLNPSPGIQGTLFGSYWAKGMMHEAQTSGELALIDGYRKKYSSSVEPIDGYINIDQLFGDRARQAKPGDIIEINIRDIMIVNSVMDNRQSASISQQLIQDSITQNPESSKYLFDTVFKPSIDKHLNGEVMDLSTPQGRGQANGFPHFFGSWSINSAVYRAKGALRGAIKGTVPSKGIAATGQAIGIDANAHHKNCIAYCANLLETVKPEDIMFIGPLVAKGLALEVKNDNNYTIANMLYYKPPMAVMYNNLAKAKVVVLPWLKGYVVYVSTEAPFVTQHGSDFDGDSIVLIRESFCKGILREDVTLNEELGVLSDIRIESSTIMNPTIADLVMLGDNNYNSKVGVAETTASKIDDALLGRAIVSEITMDKGNRVKVYKKYLGGASVHDRTEAVKWTQAEIDKRKKRVEFIAKFLDTKEAFLKYGMSLRQFAKKIVGSVKFQRRIDLIKRTLKSFVDNKSIELFDKDTVLGISIPYVVDKILAMQETPTKWTLKGYIFAHGEFVPRPNLSDSIADIISTSIPLGLGKVMLEDLIGDKLTDEHIGMFTDKINSLLSNNDLITKLIEYGTKYRDLLNDIREINISIYEDAEDYSQDQLDEMYSKKDMRKSALSALCVNVFYTLSKYAYEPAIDLAIWAVAGMYINESLWFRIAPEEVIHAVSAAYWKLHEAKRFTHNGPKGFTYSSLDEVQADEVAISNTNAVTYKAWTDGSCKGNPGPGGAGVVIKKFVSDKLITDKKISWHIGDKVTNNIAELSAVIKAMSLIKDKDADIEVYTDSAYIVKGINEWISGWKARDWHTANKKTIKNVELWKKLDTLLSSMPNVSIKKVAGHAGIAENELADQLAKNGADEVNS